MLSATAGSSGRISIPAMPMPISQQAKQRVRKYEAAGQTVASDGYTFTVRYCKALKGMDSDHYRILFDGDIYNITLVDDFQFRHETLKLTATKVRR